MSHPHTTQSDRDAIEDRGLIEDDQTEDLRSGNTTTPVLEHRGRQNQPVTQMKEEVR